MKKFEADIVLQVTVPFEAEVDDHPLITGLSREESVNHELVARKEKDRAKELDVQKQRENAAKKAEGELAEILKNALKGHGKAVCLYVGEVREI